MNTYFELGLGFIYLPTGERIKNGFLYQEPNEKYDLWLPENCKPIYFSNWLKDKIPPNLPKPKAGPKSGDYRLIRPRPIVCVETGKFYMSIKDCIEDTGIVKCGKAAGRA